MRSGSFLDMHLSHALLVTLLLSILVTSAFSQDTPTDTETSNQCVASKASVYYVVEGPDGLVGLGNWIKTVNFVSEYSKRLSQDKNMQIKATVVQHGRRPSVVVSNLPFVTYQDSKDEVFDGKWNEGRTNLDQALVLLLQSMAGSPPEEGSQSHLMVLTSGETSSGGLFSATTLLHAQNFTKITVVGISNNTNVKQLTSLAYPKEQWNFSDNLLFIDGYGDLTTELARNLSDLISCDSEEMVEVVTLKPDEAEDQETTLGIDPMDRTMEPNDPDETTPESSGETDYPTDEESTTEVPDYSEEGTTEKMPLVDPDSPTTTQSIEETPDADEEPTSAPDDETTLDISEVETTTMGMPPLPPDPPTTVSTAEKIPGSTESQEEKSTTTMGIPPLPLDPSSTISTSEDYSESTDSPDEESTTDIFEAVNETTTMGMPPLPPDPPTTMSPSIDQAPTDSDVEETTVSPEEVETEKETDSPIEDGVSPGRIPEEWTPPPSDGNSGSEITVSTTGSGDITVPENPETTAPSDTAERSTIAAQGEVTSRSTDTAGESTGEAIVVTAPSEEESTEETTAVPDEGETPGDLVESETMDPLGPDSDGVSPTIPTDLEDGNQTPAIPEQESTTIKSVLGEETTTPEPKVPTEIDPTTVDEEMKVVTTSSIPDEIEASTTESPAIVPQTFPQTPRTTTLDPDCSDKDVFCPEWARKGHCSANPVAMNTLCRKSCNACGMTKREIVVMQYKNEPCENLWESSPHFGWCTSFTDEECAENLMWAAKFCRKHCNLCA